MDGRIVDIQVQEIQDEIRLRNVELEDVEKQLENEPDPFAETFPASMAFNCADYSVGNVATCDSDPLQSSMAFNGSGYPGGNVVSGGSNKRAPWMEFSGTEYLAVNEVNDSSNQFDYRFFSLPKHDQFLNADFASGNDIQQGRTTPATAGQSQVVEDAAEGNGGSSPSLHDFPEIPFPFYPAST
ncbi:hypothetical protein JRO89_XS09G0116000 [Xanthoceras sorbifolium]|uniref:Uncharacterized protein n=1 Tax=Xanthoceras sorbifolium TaxID=99658 RepID=A0ABQ8HL92_9ROSI|nr:hypothetical protein JRO89_XS09G0116000 [Xanthoceras sorbifolium]